MDGHTKHGVFAKAGGLLGRYDVTVRDADDVVVRVDAVADSGLISPVWHPGWSMGPEAHSAVKAFRHIQMVGTAADTE